MTSRPTFKGKRQPLVHKAFVGATPRALVAFGGQTELAWLRLLRPGFRHCFALVEIPGDGVDNIICEDGSAPASRWALYNPLSNGTQLEVWPPIPEHVLSDGLRQQGYVVLETRVRRLSLRLFAWRPYTCVEAVKRVIGLHAPGVFTPWQLYRLIKNARNRKKILDLRE